MKADIPPEIRGWSWGGFLLSWIWGIFNGTLISLLALIPIVNVVMCFVLGAKGREWAWRNKKWDNVEHFKKVQKQWALAGIIVVVASIILSFFLATLVLFQLNVARTKARDVRRISDMHQIQTAVQYYYEDHGEYPSDISNTLIGPYFESGNVPLDPFSPFSPTHPYGYAFDRASGRYQIYTTLENKSTFLEKDADVDTSHWSPKPGVNGLDSNRIYDLSNKIQ